jgi:hypothetical protein
VRKFVGAECRAAIAQPAHVSCFCWSVLAYSPLGRGLLTGHLKDTSKLDPSDFRVTASPYEQENLQQVSVAQRHHEECCIEKAEEFIGTGVHSWLTMLQLLANCVLCLVWVPISYLQNLKL